MLKQKKQGANLKKTSKAVKKTAAKPTRKVTKRTMVTKRSTAPSISLPQQQPQLQSAMMKTPTQNLKSISFISTFHKQTATPTILSTPARFFGGAAALPFGDEPYHGVQVEKYGKGTRADLYPVHSPEFKANFVTLAMDGSDYDKRPLNQTITPEEMIAKFAVTLVNQDVAVCDGTSDGPHPREFIQVNISTPKIPQICKYCGHRFMMKSAWDGSIVAINSEQ